MTIKAKIFMMMGWVFFALATLLLVNEIKVSKAAPVEVTGYSFSYDPTSQTIQATGTWIGADIACKLNQAKVVADLKNNVVTINEADIAPFATPMLVQQDDTYPITSVTDDTITAVEKLHNYATAFHPEDSGEVTVIIDIKNKVVHVAKFSSMKEFSYNYSLGDGHAQYVAAQKAALVWPLSLFAR